MTLEKIQTKLLQVARQNPPAQDVPYAFEKRIMAHLSKPVVDVWAMWGRALWRSAAACVIAMAVLGGWSWQSAPTANTDLAQDFEKTVFAALDERPLNNNGFEEIW